MKIDIVTNYGVLNSNAVARNSWKSIFVTTKAYHNASTMCIESPSIYQWYSIISAAKSRIFDDIVYDIIALLCGITTNWLQRVEKSVYWICQSDVQELIRICVTLRPFTSFWFYNVNGLNCVNWLNAALNDEFWVYSFHYICELSKLLALVLIFQEKWTHAAK